MTINDFIAMDENEQALVLWKGAVLDGRNEEEYKILLYQIDGFYVEVYFHKQLQTIDRFEPFESISLLEPYLDKIDVSYLV